MKIHADDCPALCHCPVEMGHRHACTCTAGADLAELVAAAESAIRKEALCLDWLDKALKPFRKEEL